MTDLRSDTEQPAAVEPKAETPPSLEPPSTTPRDPSGDARPPRRRWWRGLFRAGIQSKLLLAMLVTSVASALVVGIIGYQSGRQALRKAAFAQLTELRATRAEDITRFFDQLTNSMIIYTRGTTAINAVRDFTSGFDALQNTSVTAAQRNALDAYYQNVFIKNLNANQGTSTTATGFEPTSSAQEYLQAHYTAPYADFDDAIKVNDAGDGSAWSAAHAKYHDYFRQMVTRFDYEDALLLDNRGNVVYSAYSGVDLGTNIRTGPYRGSALATAYTKAENSNEVDYAALTDFSRYQPSYDVPTGWAVSPIGSAGHVDGVLAVQLPNSAINDIMTSEGRWKATGLGDTGETYLIGPDRMMRSTSRLVLQHPKEYEKQAVSAGLDPALAAKAARVKGTVLIQTVNTNAARQALQGHTGTTMASDYLGREALVSYAPLRIPGLNWAIVAKIQTSEAFAPASDFAWRMAIATATIVLLVCLAALLLAQFFVRPVRRLVTGVNQIAAGDLDTQVDASAKDEFGELGRAFNQMSRSLRAKQELIDEQQAENDRLLLNLMPETVAKRYREGEKTISEDHQNVSVLYADLRGFDEFTESMPSARSLDLLNDLVRAFDEAAARIGVEKVRTLRNGYLASCGLTIPRIDNARRIAQFALEMVGIVERFNAVNGTRLALRAGIDSGPVSSGLVGRTTVVYDMWGDAVNLANRLRNTGDRAGVFITGRVYEKLGDQAGVSEAGFVETQGGTQPVWHLESLR